MSTTKQSTSQPSNTQPSNTNQWLAQSDSTDLSIRNFIDGEFIPQPQNLPEQDLIQKHSGRDGRLLYSFAKGSFEDADRAVASAKAAFDDGRWSGMTLGQRSAILGKLADLLERDKDRFALYESLDVGKPIAKSQAADLAIAIGTLRGIGQQAQQLTAPCDADLGSFSYLRRKPAGVVAGIAGWNFPLVLAVQKVAPSLVMGNTLVLKPSEFTSLSAQHLAALAIEAGVPAGVFNVVHGAGQTVGARLAEHPDVALLSFVGSSATGKQLMISAGQSNMKRLILECGGKSPFLVFDDCYDLNAVAQTVVDNAFPNQGALCVAGTRLLIQNSLRERLMPLILEKAASIKAGDPLNESTAFGALMNEAHMQKVLSYIDSGREEGAELLLGGKQMHPEGRDDLQQGFYIEPTIFDGVKPDARIAQEEIFGPVLSVFGFDDEDEAIALANNSSFGLAAYAATTDIARGQRLGERLNAGNLMLFASAQPRFGTVGIGSDKQRESGIGYSGGAEGLAAYSVSTTVRLMS
jgi:acyl-CoA reductase-like NAD-dependent aldehyde dehydrogenase